MDRGAEELRRLTSKTSHTSLGFYRKYQTLESLREERPKSLDALRHILLRSTKDVEARLQELEQIFYEGMECEVYLRHILPAFHDVMDNFQVTYLHGVWQIDDVMRRFAKHGIKYGASPENVHVFRGYGVKVKNFIPNNFKPLMNDITEIVQFAEKYCVSFFNGQKDKFLETPQHYETIRKEYQGSVKMHLNNINNIGKSYKVGGLTSKLFGLSVNEIARRCDCEDKPVVLAFPESCNNIRLAIEAIEKWVQMDAHYTEFIKNDVSEMEIERDMQEKLVRECKHNVTMIDHRLKLTQKQAIELDEQLKRLAPRAEQMDGDIAKLNAKIKDLEMDIAVKEDEKNEIKTFVVKGSGGEDMSENDKIDKLSGEITKLKLSISLVNRHIEQRKEKVQVIIERREKMEAKGVVITTLVRHKIKAKTQVLLATRQLERVERCLGILRHIYRLKTSPDITRKIFSNMPMEARNNRLLPRRNKSADEKSKPGKK